MIDLDNKLREILANIITQETGEETTAAMISDSYIGQIKQAFADEGYFRLKSENLAAAGKVGYMLTGQEWYERFEKNLKGKLEYQQHDMGEMGKFIRPEYAKNVSLEAAKRAAGIDNES